MNRGEKFSEISYLVREAGPYDCVVEVNFCGICHSDIHRIKGDWVGSIYPCVPGHEMTGVVIRVGSSVTLRNIGERVAVGCYIDSCGACGYCRSGREQFCLEAVETYHSRLPDGTMTQGGYGQYITANERWVFKLPDNLPMDKAAPLTCAGITTFDPIRRHASKGGIKVAVVGLGGLGHMAVQWAVAFRNEVTVITSHGDKKELSKKLGASHVMTHSEIVRGEFEDEIFDYIIDTCSVHRDQSYFQKLLNLLKCDCTYTVIGLPSGDEYAMIQTSSLVAFGKTIEGSLVGGIKHTQEMLNFAGEHNILPLIELVDTEHIDATYERIEAGEIHFRAVMDIKGRS